MATLTAVQAVFGEAEIVLARELTERFEEIISAPASAHLKPLGAGEIRGEFTLVIPS